MSPTASSWAELRRRPSRRVFERATAERSGGFLHIHCSEFEELDQEGEVCARGVREFVTPGPFSLNTLSTALLLRRGEHMWLGVDDDDLPAAQAFEGNSQLLVAPAWRLPRAIKSMTPALAFMKERLRKEYGLEVGETWQLGGPYYPSLGMTPEVVHPIAAEVLSIGAGPRSLHWLSIEELLHQRNHIRDGHLRIAMLRAAHALGFLPESTADRRS